MCEWNKYRLVSVQDNLQDSLIVLRLNILRYGYLIKANLNDEIRKSLTDVGYHLGTEIDDVSVVLHFNKPLLPVTVDELIYQINKITRSCVLVYFDDSRDVVLFVECFSK